MGGQRFDGRLAVGLSYKSASTAFLGTCCPLVDILVYLDNFDESSDIDASRESAKSCPIFISLDI